MIARFRQWRAACCTPRLTGSSEGQVERLLSAWARQGLADRHGRVLTVIHVPSDMWSLTLAGVKRVTPAARTGWPENLNTLASPAPGTFQHDQAFLNAARFIASPSGEYSPVTERAATGLYAALRAAAAQGQSRWPYQRFVEDSVSVSLAEFTQRLSALGDERVEHALECFLGAPVEQCDWDNAERDPFLKHAWAHLQQCSKQMFGWQLIPRPATDRPGPDAAARPWP